MTFPIAPWFVGVLAILIAAEALAGLKTDRHRYELNEFLCNIGSFLLGRITRFLLFGASFPALTDAVDDPLPFLGAFVLVDFLYYWQHRLLHTLSPLWPFHAVHHSSPRFDLSTSLRLSWFAPLLAPVFFLPAVLVGFPLRTVAAALTLNLMYQAFLHTPWVGKLGPVEGILNTPSAHRVHHALNAKYVDKNFGGFLLVWDRLFGTYAAETEPPRYGAGTSDGHNPFWIQLAPFARYFRLKPRAAPTDQIARDCDV